MATSGTATFDLDAIDIIEEAYEMAGMEARSGYDMRTARRSLNLLMAEWSNRGLNLWTIDSQTASFAAGVGTATLAADTIDVLDVVWRTGSGSSQQDRMIDRVSVKQWAQITAKNQTGLPAQYWVNRTVPPVISIWPLPASAGSIVYYRLRRIEDAGEYSNTMDVPSRFLPAMTAGLAYYLSIKRPELAERIPMLQAEYERQFRLAAEEDRERASLFLRPYSR